MKIKVLYFHKSKVRDFSPHKFKFRDLIFVNVINPMPNQKPNIVNRIITQFDLFTIQNKFGD